jgi:hypothetical protein
MSGATSSAAARPRSAVTSSSATPAATSVSRLTAAAIAYQNKAVVYDIRFRAAAENLRTIATDPKNLGAEVGFIAILHTWGQNLMHHPHLHCLVPGGGISPDGEQWVACRPGFFLPVRDLSRLFRRLFVEHLLRAFDDGVSRFFNALAHLQAAASFAAYLAPVASSEWVVYAKPPFGGRNRCSRTSAATRIA